MITEQAKVSRIDGNLVELQLQRQSSCGQCELSKGCGTGALSRLIGRREKPFVIENKHKLELGDSVVIGISETGLVRASLLIYGLPVFTMILAGLSVFAFTESQEWLVTLFSAVGFLLGMKLSSHLVKSATSSHLHPDIVDIHLNPSRKTGS
jgi:sigma-E factor negative regulatory protein RseC